MEHKLLPALAAGLLAAAFGAGCGSSETGTNPTKRTLKLVERADNDVVTDLGDMGDSVGDVLTFANAVFDEANDKQVGTDQGYCIRTKVGVSWECNWTVVLDDGHISVEGPFLDASDSVLAITGGTGAYVEARGEMKLHARNAEGTEFDFIYEIR
jgi:allene oxide cyclase